MSGLTIHVRVILSLFTASHHFWVSAYKLYAYTMYTHMLQGNCVLHVYRDKVAAY